MPLLLPQFFQSPRRLVQCLRLLAESETYLLGAVFWMLVETRSRHTGDPDFFDKIAGEFDVIGKVEGGDVGHHVVRAPRAIAAETGIFECWNQLIAALPVSFSKLVVVAGRKTQRDGSCLLERSWR